MIKAKGYIVEYVGDRAFETDSRIVLSGEPDHQMGGTEQKFFENVAQNFLSTQLELEDSDNASLSILGVSVNGQDVMTSDLSTTDSAHRMLGQTYTNNIDVKVMGKYRPPPEIDFGKLI